MVVIFLLFSAMIHSHEYVPCEKTYILSENIFVGLDEIFVKIHDQLFTTESLYRDPNGLYIQSLSLSAAGCAGSKVPCRNCHRCVYEAWDICPYCNKPI